MAEYHNKIHSNEKYWCELCRVSNIDKGSVKKRSRGEENMNMAIVVAAIGVVAVLVSIVGIATKRCLW